jgi:flagellar hook-length control protein FliK
LSANAIENTTAASIQQAVSHPSQPFEVISLTGSAPGLAGVATNLANFVIKEITPISEMPKVTIMTLEPKDLGTIVVKMTMDGSGLQMELGVSNPHVSAMLNSSLSQLKESISTASGMSVHIGFSSNPNLSGQGRPGTQTPQGATSPSQYMGDSKPATPSGWPTQQPVGSSSSHRLDRRI